MINQWLGRQDSNLRMTVPKTVALPLGDAPAWHAGGSIAAARRMQRLSRGGAASRLARAFGKRFGDKAYAFEELVAEIGAGLVCAELGLPNELHGGHASYVAHWLGILRADKTAIIHAASKAEQAFAYLCSFAEA